MKNIQSTLFPFGWRDNLEYIGAIPLVLLLTDSRPTLIFVTFFVTIGYIREVYAYHSGKTVWKFQPISRPKP